ncbi:MAG: metal-sulfur cluster assembly factor [Bifidobacteriaceae bacterium]|jgi:metal-sulfur cluster biosynthetic enzyme|nr:metal-sulfur cluster assembly factor [Bifidobacteriaceae bacterium]
MSGSPYTSSDFPPPPEARVAASAPSAALPTAADVEEALRDVIDPELGINVVDLGLLYGVSIDGAGRAAVDMTLTSAACPLTDLIESQAAAALEGLVTGVDINWVWSPPWGPDRITPDGREQLRALGFNV